MSIHPSHKARADCKSRLQPHVLSHTLKKQHTRTHAARRLEQIFYVVHKATMHTHFAYYDTCAVHAPAGSVKVAAEQRD